MRETCSIALRRMCEALLILATLSSLHCAGARAPETPAADEPPSAPELIAADFAMPPFYRVTGGEGGELLVMGTIHLGPVQGWRFAPAIDEGLERANRIVLEIDLRLATEELISTALMQMVILEPPDTLPKVVSPETRKLLDEMDAELAALGLPRLARQRLKPWYVAMGLIESTAQQSGYSALGAAERSIMQRLGGRPLDGLESAQDQLQMLDGMSATAQDALLRDALLRLDHAAEDVQQLVEAWRTGDEEALTELVRVGVEEVPELAAVYDVVNRDRNRSWVAPLRAYLDDPALSGQTVFVGIGALHVVGDEGVVALLREQGYRVEPVDPFERTRSLER
jgi:hypothetical protein